MCGESLGTRLPFRLSGKIVNLSADETSQYIQSSDFSKWVTPWKVAHKHLVTTWWRWSSHLNVVDKRVHLLRKMSPHHFNLQVINGRRCSWKHGSVTSTHHFLEGWDDVWQLAKDTDVLRNGEKIQSPAMSLQHGVDCAGSTKQSTLAVEEIRHRKEGTKVRTYTHETWQLMLTL